MKFWILIYFLLLCFYIKGQSPSFESYLNPVIPGDHPDPTLTRIGDYFYTSGSSFNPTPKIYRSTDLVHWEVIAQPVSASWSQYGNSPGGGIWGGHMVFYNGRYWHFFGKGGGSMYFVTADQPEGPWNTPTRMNVPSSMPAGLGVDNSIFIDDDGKWYLLTKAGQPNNHIVELGTDGQPTGKVLDLTWLNPAPSYPYGWAEGPVMWKYNGYYYYSFAQHLAGAQYVMRSDTLTDVQSAWTIIGSNIFTGSTSNYSTPNHISPAVLLADGTSWVIAHSYHSSTWYAQGRQGLLCQLKYNDQGFPVMQYPSTDGVEAPNLPSSGIPWMVAKSDPFKSSKLSPNWSFLGYTPDNTYSLTQREGWLYLAPYSGANTIVQNDGEHNYSIITKVDFSPQSVSDEAGLWIINGPENLQAKVFSSSSSTGEKILAFGFNSTLYQTPNPLDSIVWLKLIRNEHTVSGFYSSDGADWIQIGSPINAADIDIEQTQFNNFTGNQQGIYVKGKPAYFDLYIYKDAYTNIAAQSPANKLGVSSGGSYLTSINNNDWAMYAGVEFGNNDYPKSPISMELSASSVTSANGVVEVWLDSIDTGRKIAECPVDTTGSLTNYKIFRADVDSVSGSHDVYLKFLGMGTGQLFRMNWFRFLSIYDTPTSVEPEKGELKNPGKFELNQNYPNPFNPTTTISFNLPVKSYVHLTLFDILGNVVREITQGNYFQGEHKIELNASDLATGIYFCKLEAGDFVKVRKLLLLK
ncbi:MAG TPA: family 43 glycosylhydrolase [Ignavibacteriaceae bacterium]|nr:family 43 glycosylhydrolase [Ignavibacteriaceae bacterium]